MKKLYHVGLDVHARTISVAVADGRDVKSVGTIDHDAPRLLKLLAKVGPQGCVRICYEAGPTGYGLCRIDAKPRPFCAPRTIGYSSSAVVVATALV